MESSPRADRGIKLTEQIAGQKFCPILIGDHQKVLFAVIKIDPADGAVVHGKPIHTVVAGDTQQIAHHLGVERAVANHRYGVVGSSVLRV